eukprot:IDg197t1
MEPLGRCIRSETETSHCLGMNFVHMHAQYCIWRAISPIFKVGRDVIRSFPTTRLSSDRLWLSNFAASVGSSIGRLPKIQEQALHQQHAPTHRPWWVQMSEAIHS